MVKDKLKEFQALADKQMNGRQHGIDSTDVFSINVGEGTSTSDWSSVEEFLAKVKTTKRQLAEMQECFNRMRKIHNEILSSAGIHTKFTEDLNETVEKFKILAHSVSDDVKSLNAKVQFVEGSQDSGARIKQNQAMLLSRNLNEILLQFNNEQILYRDKCKSKINSYLSIAGLNVSEEEVDEAIENGKLFNTVGILMADRDKKVLFDDVKSRHDDIIRLESSIRELHDMFQDMSMLVESQGVMVNNIEANVANTVEYTNKALYSVNYAKEAKRRNIKLKICLLIFIIIAILVLFTVGGAAFCFYLPFVCRS